MLNKEIIIKILSDMDLPKDEYWVTSGAALVLHAVKEATGDIDLGCTTSLTEYFIKRGCKYKALEDSTRIVEVNNKLELLENWFVDEIEWIEGLPVASLESIKKQKQELGRAKDIDDIKIINNFLSSNS